MTIDSGILLESGTNELEMIEFEINQQKFGINVLKVKEIIQPLPLTSIPHAHDNILGLIQLRGEVLPVISMARALNMEESDKQRASSKLIVAEFNMQKVVFQVDHVSQIHRISWSDIEKPGNVYSDANHHIIGVIQMLDEMILLIDFEKIVVDIQPESGIHMGKIKSLGKRERSAKRIIVAEDSPLLRNLMKETLSEAGYENVNFFENGLDALEYLRGIVNAGKDVYQEVQLVITDIEMPQMDGHHLVKRIKEDEGLSRLPVIIFSSLISDELRHKGEKVGAVEQISKPEIGELVLKVDQHIL
ncbi:chemotaxis protein [Bacillus sp. FJAT-50079]|uniref:chemotaxis protein n=1 Tax=Bacillus sp. FJAT-50079 TaxID=2833577 RepID=UPI001BC9C2DC|nr:chemotaxis protein [Bacillus sp. FJAT-50079]MBS4207803.1 chemotaxis protein CheV [Bacillus sp. FJAT-50079]